MSTARTRPVWDDVTARTADWWSESPPSRGCDAVVVGAGIAGLSLALRLLQAGRDVVLVDREGCGAGETLRTTAHLASALDDRYTRLARYHGREGARMAAASHAAPIDWIETLALQAAHGCGFRRVPGYLVSCRGELAPLEREAEAAAAAGLRAEVLEEGVPLLPALGPALRFADQARVDMGLYLMHLAHLVREGGARFVRAEATTIEGGNAPRVTLRDGSEIVARQVVAASNVPFHGTTTGWLKQAAYRTYAVAGPAPRDSVPDALLWDDADPYHYVRLLDGEHEDEVIVIVGGEDHKVGQDDDPEAYVRLQAWARERDRKSVG